MTRNEMALIVALGRAANMFAAERQEAEHQEHMLDAVRAAVVKLGRCVSEQVAQEAGCSAASARRALHKLVARSLVRESHEPYTSIVNGRRYETIRAIYRIAK